LMNGVAIIFLKSNVQRHLQALNQVGVSNDINTSLR
jgi:ribosomal protein L31E